MASSRQLPTITEDQGKNGDPVLRATAAIHEACVAARLAMTCCGGGTAAIEARNYQNARSSGSGEGGQGSAVQVSPLVKASMDRADDLSYALKLLSILMVLETITGDFVLGGTRESIVDVCSCAYHRVAGLSGDQVWDRCSAEQASMSIDALMGNEAH